MEYYSSDGSYNETEDCPTDPTIRSVIRDDDLVQFKTIISQTSDINKFYLTYKHAFFFFQ